MNAPPDTKPVALYARVSSDEQREQQTIRTQIEYARGRAKLEGWTLREFIDDGVSGKKLPLAKRPGGAELLEAARRGEISRVISYRLDRLARRARFIHEALEDFTSAGVAYASLTEPFDTATPAGKLFLGVLAVMAEFESDSITQRTSDGRRRVAGLDNRWTGGPVPYGYDVGDDGLLMIDASEAKVVRDVFRWTIEEGWGCARVAAELNARGVAYNSTGPRAGKRHERRAVAWHPVAVNRILRAELYAGRAAYGRASKSAELVYRNVPRIITPTTYLAAREAVAAHRRWNGAHARREYRLRGLITCARDGHALIARMWRKDPAYYCDECPKGARPLVRETAILEILWRDVLDFLTHPDDALRAMARSVSDIGSIEDRTERELLDLARQIRELDDQEEQLLDLRLAKTITSAVLERKAKAVQTRREQLRMRMETVRAERAAAARAVEESVTVRRLLLELRPLAERVGTDLAKRAEIIRTVTKGVVVHTASGRQRVEVTYAFARPAGVGKRVAVSPTV